MAFRWRADDGPLLVAFRSPLHPISKKKNKKKPVSVGPPLTKLSGSAHVDAEVCVYGWNMGLSFHPR